MANDDFVPSRSTKHLVPGMSCCVDAIFLPAPIEFLYIRYNDTSQYVIMLLLT